MSHDANVELCHRFLDAIERGDLRTVLEIYAPDVVVWHNTDSVCQTREENLRVVASIFELLADRRYTERRVVGFEGGFIDQHVLTGRLRSGEIFRLPACLICAVSEGRITRLDEYLDQKTVDRQLAPGRTPAQ